jgi:hypothetical protein
VRSAEQPALFCARSSRRAGVDDEETCLFAVLGGTDPGRVASSPELVRRAKARGWALDADGDLVTKTQAA